MDTIHPHFSAYLEWRREGLLSCDGVVVGSDQTHEWLLPWWWGHYQRSNDFPVTFIDFGMSKEMKCWCLERGELISLPLLEAYLPSKEEIDPALVHSWEKAFGQHFWRYRHAWFKKPLACLRSPYARTIWIDIDCEIRASLQDLFSFCEHPSHLALAYDYSTEDLSLYNSGVIVFKQGQSLLQEWASSLFTDIHAFAGDQDSLSKILHEKNVTPNLLPQVYNWLRCYPDNPDALILHWHGDVGKRIITHQILRSQLGSVP